MPATPSNPLEPGAPAPALALPEPLTGQIVELEDVAAGASAVLVAFLSNRCPYVLLIQDALNALARDYRHRGVRVVGINSNAQEVKAEENAEQVAAHARENGFVFPYLRDESQDVARAYDAACTPDLYLYDGSLHLYYHGQFDTARPGSDAPVTGADLRSAIDALLAGEPAPTRQIPSVGCNIKWREGDARGVLEAA
ncbi:thioredoxin family protein [Sphingomonas desiccabilis]|uniref:Thioredoxin family protein n=1 Tax=Sphingomonas desiccabilis TaxID=429134 RepID=A0A4V1QP04_9SPHN|nr:thioredoxin family protein [Sphingomonas desiccabilis]MBB3911808.1 peroxiredoxin [Sphingomonas desiccabilis]RXZ31474.1 thioredoxin family protein [Sphingomonas desiccabilis]